MKKSIRLIALLLSLIMLLGAFTSCDLLETFLSTDEDDDTTEDTGADVNADCPHLWIGGICRLCATPCTHEWVPGGCKICDEICYHQGIHENEICSVCGKDLTDAPFDVTVTTDCESNIVDGMSTFGRAESLKEMFIHIMTGRGYYMYISAGTVNVYLNGTLVTDYNTLVKNDCTLRIELKENVARIDLSVIGNRDTERDIIYIPSGMSLSLIGDILYPEKGGLSYLLNIAKIEIDGSEVTDPDYVIDKNCEVTITMNSGSGGMRSFVASLTDERTGLSSEMTVDSSFTIEDAINKLLDMQGSEPTPLAQLLLVAEIRINGERIYKNDFITSDSKIEIIPFSDGHIRISFVGAPDLGKGDTVACADDFTAGVTFEEVVEALLGIDWATYEESYYNTRITTYGSHETWIAVDKDTVFTESHEISALKYNDTPRQDKVYLTIGFSFLGVKAQTLELDYDTTISEAFDSIGVDLDMLLERAQLFINTYRLVADAKIKYDSFIYGWTVCEHVWDGRTCTECGTYCQSEYYGEGNCTVCGAYHPSEHPDLKHVTVEIYTNNGVLIESIDFTFYSSIKPPEVLRELGYETNQGYVYINGKLDPGPVEYSELFGGETLKFYLIDDTDICYHSWGGGVCSECGAVCEHANAADNYCPTCYCNLITITFTTSINGNVSEPEIYIVIGGSTLYEFANKIGYTSGDVENGYFRVDGESKRIWYFITDSAVCYYIACNHTYVEGVCSNCGHPCEHQRHTMLPNICTVCGMDIGYPDAPPHVHTWVNSQCTGCWEWCNEDLSHTFADGTCTNCGCTFGGEDHYIYLLVEGLYEGIESDIYYHIHYSTTLTQFLESIKDYYNPIDFTYYLINKSNMTVQINESTVIGTYGSSLILFADRHYHSWRDGVCTACGYECLHGKAEDSCLECGMINPFNYNFIMYDDVKYRLTSGVTLYQFLERMAVYYVYFDDAALVGYWVLESANTSKVIYRDDLIGEEDGTLIYIERTGEIDADYCSHHWNDSDYCKFCGAHKEDYNR